MGYIPHVGMSPFREGHTPTRYLIKDQVAPEHLWGLIHQGPRPRIKPCPRHGYRGPCPGALDISRGFNCLVPDQEPQSCTRGPLRDLYCFVPDQELIHQGTSPSINPCPRHGYAGPCPRALDISRGFNCLVPDQEPQSYTGGPNKGLFCLVPDQEPQSYTGGPYKGLLPWH
jgi:hypothetical protein